MTRRVTDGKRDIPRRARQHASQATPLNLAAVLAPPAPRAIRFIRMILGFHCIISTYGFWLPNEQRGSWSDFVRSWELFRYGPATKVPTPRSVAHHPYDPTLKRQMQRTLKYAPVRFTGHQARLVGMSL